MSLKGFEDINPDLSKYELEMLLPAMLPAFLTKIGVKNAVKGKDIAAGMKARGFKKCTDVRVRKIINYIRRKNLILGLIATSKGYYISNDKEEIADYITSLDGRTNEIMKVRAEFYRYYLTLKHNI